MNLCRRCTLALLVFSIILTFPVMSRAFNEWDKVAHFGVSGIFGAASETYLHYKTELKTPERIVYSTFLGIVPGIFKELYDDRNGESFDWGDMAANAGGALTGALISNYVNNKIQVDIDTKAKSAKISYKVEF